MRVATDISNTGLNQVKLGSGSSHPLPSNLAVVKNIWATMQPNVPLAAAMPLQVARYRVGNISAGIVHLSVLNHTYGREKLTMKVEALGPKLKNIRHKIFKTDTTDSKAEGPQGSFCIIAIPPFMTKAKITKLHRYVFLRGQYFTHLCSMTVTPPPMIAPSRTKMNVDVLLVT